MGLIHNPQICFDKLVVYLDAANSNSYPGSGNIWYNLINDKINAQLFNGPTYNNDNGGSLVFDAVDDYFSGNFTCNKTYYSLDFWCYPTTLINWNWYIGFNDFWGDFALHAASDGSVYVGTSVASRIGPWRTNVFVLNTWQNFTWTFNNGEGKFYKNGILEAYNPNLQLSTRSQFTTYGAGRGTIDSCAGRISNFKVYSNKVLTQEEIKKNYNILKYRYK